MVDISYFFLCLCVMSVVTYLIRMLPMVCLRRKISSRFVLSFFYYIPYSVLAAMTFPAAFFSSEPIYAAAAGVTVAVVLAFFKRGLLTVAIGSCAAIFLTQLIF